MCGIAGFVRREGSHPADREVLSRMTRCLAHRGPDDEGAWTGGGAHLGHRRLSIIDLAGGKQPIASEDGRVVVVFNGEIYNHHELREELLARGHVFATRSDTEVLVHLWEDEREAMLGRLNGMFAIALWDGRDRTLLLARDRMGKKPLYWGLFDGELVFGSELRAMMAHPSVPRQVDPAALYRFLTLDYVPTPYAILKHVHKVEPGGWVLFNEGAAREGLYTDLRRPATPLALPPADAAAMVWETLRKATQARLESEVPLGVFLSGGIDSTAVLAAMAADVDPSRIRTFTVGFQDKSYDESAAARETARHFGTEHHERVLTGAEARALVPQVAAIADEPLADYSLLATHLLCRFAREHVTVALSGDGGDELFFGYETFRYDRAARWAAAALPGWVRRRALPWAVGRMPVSDRDLGLDYKAGRFVRGLKYGRFERHMSWVGGFDPGEARGVLHPDVASAIGTDEAYPDVAGRLARCEGWPDLPALAYLYSRLYLQDGVLVKVDRASMAVALEVRSPFLDPEMVRLAFALPPDLSLSGGTTKALLRRMLAGKVPPSVLGRPKKGFGVPLARWLREDLAGLVDEHLAPGKLAREGYFRPEVVQSLVDQHRSGRANRRKEIWSLLVFELWLSRYVL